MPTYLHKCSADGQMRQWLSLYIRVRSSNPSPQGWGVRSHVKRSWERIGFICSVCGIELTDAAIVSRTQAREPAPRSG